MIKQREGRIINVSSFAGGIAGFEDLSDYSASKVGVIGFTRTLALEVGEYGINVNAMLPYFKPHPQVMVE